MVGHELVEAMIKAFGETGRLDGLVMVRDKDSGTMHSVVAVDAEVHTDADGSVTYWLTTTEY